MTSAHLAVCAVLLKYACCSFNNGQDVIIWFPAHLFPNGHKHQLEWSEGVHVCVGVVCVWWGEVGGLGRQSLLWVFQDCFGQQLSKRPFRRLTSNCAWSSELASTGSSAKRNGCCVLQLLERSSHFCSSLRERIGKHFASKSWTKTHSELSVPEQMWRNRSLQHYQPKLD